MGRWCFCGCSNAIVVILNAGIMLTSLLVLSLWAMTARDLPKACNKFVQSPLLLLGAALLVVSLAGIIGACCRISVLLWFYLVTSLLVILGISCFTVFLFVVSNKGVAAAVSGHGVGGLRLGDYSGWLQRTVSDAGHWENIQKCLRGTGLCADLQDVPEKYTVLNRTTLFPVQASFFSFFCSFLIFILITFFIFFFSLSLALSLPSMSLSFCVPLIPLSLCPSLSISLFLSVPPSHRVCTSLSLSPSLSSFTS